MILGSEELSTNALIAVIAFFTMITIISVAALKYGRDEDNDKEGS